MKMKMNWEVGKGINKWKMENRKDQTRDECEREEKKWDRTEKPGIGRAFFNSVIVSGLSWSLSNAAGLLLNIELQRQTQNE